MSDLQHTLVLKRASTVVLVAIMLVGGAGIASAQEPNCDDIGEMAQRGAALFGEGNFEEAARVLEQAYACEPHDLLLYNIARAHQQAGRCVLSADYFRRYLDTSDTTTRTQAEGYLPEEQECADGYEDAYASAEQALTARDYATAISSLEDALVLSNEPEARVYLGEIMVTAQQCEEAQAYFGNIRNDDDLSQAQVSRINDGMAQAQRCIEADDCDEARGDCEEERISAQLAYEESIESQQTIGLIVMGAGGALLAGAIIHDAISQGTISDYEDAAARGDSAAFNSLRDDVDSAKTVSWVLYSLSVATAATGLIVYLTAGGDNPAEEMDCTDVCWDFGVGSPSGASGVWLGGTF